MSIKTKNDNSYMFLLKVVDLELLNIDTELLNDSEKSESYINVFKENLIEYERMNSEIYRMISEFLKGYEYTISLKSKCISGKDYDFDSMVSFLSPYIFSEKRAHNMVSLLRQGYTINPSSYAYEMVFIMYNRVTIKLSKNEAHLMKLKDKEKYEILSEDLKRNRILKHIAGW